MTGRLSSSYSFPSLYGKSFGIWCFCRFDLAAGGGIGMWRSLWSLIAVNLKYDWFLSSEQFYWLWSQVELGSVLIISSVIFTIICRSMGSVRLKILPSPWSEIVRWRFGDLLESRRNKEEQSKGLLFFIFGFSLTNKRKTFTICYIKFPEESKKRESKGDHHMATMKAARRHAAKDVHVSKKWKYLKHNHIQVKWQLSSRGSVVRTCMNIWMDRSCHPSRRTCILVKSTSHFGTWILWWNCRSRKWCDSCQVGDRVTIEGNSCGAVVVIITSTQTWTLSDSLRDGGFAKYYVLIGDLVHDSVAWAHEQARSYRTCCGCCGAVR